jgi:ParB-like chromosome segregation protein Spo0J
MRLRLDELPAVREHLDPERVARYARELDRLPPVVVFETPEGRVLADGHHRVAAARQRGATMIDAEVRHGSRGEALRYAARHAALERGLGVDEALDRIRRRSGGDWGDRP